MNLTNVIEFYLIRAFFYYCLSISKIKLKGIFSENCPNQITENWIKYLSAPVSTWAVIKGVGIEEEYIRALDAEGFQKGEIATSSAWQLEAFVREITLKI